MDTFECAWSRTEMRIKRIGENWMSVTVEEEICSVAKFDSAGTQVNFTSVEIGEC